MRHLNPLYAAATLLSLAGCWNTNPSVLPPDLVAFDPEGAAVEGWLVQGFEVNLDCPDGRSPKFYLVHP